MAVVGVGHLGRHHARLLAAMDGVNLVGVVDTSESRAAEIAVSAGCAAYTSWQAVAGDIDAVTIAVPTEAHAEVALGFIAQGVHVLV